MINNILGHIMTICKHKFYVGIYMFKSGFYFRGIMHDMSKFSPTEFSESIKYYTKGISPINVCKKINGYSLAWQHHKGKNPHHYEYWVDNLDNGGIPIKIPYKYVVELICDYLGAAKAYLDNKFSYKNEYEWWLNMLDRNPKIHPETIKLITLCFEHFALIDKFDYNSIKEISKKLNY